MAEPTPILSGHPEIRLERFFTDGDMLVQVRSISPLGSVEYEDAATNGIDEMGCCAFARRFRPVGSEREELIHEAEEITRDSST